ncbi:hypothetical protein HZH66_006956 [Vespula vulgaris]|uniref:Uncharacterized protein n=1 Tax=Vespula vulgaris TaxID=7454 RepID=A0A834K658_VESVU|nr:hypothetical protein HZH66_006956 [Vespula vulgaris]
MAITTAEVIHFTKCVPMEIEFTSIKEYDLKFFVVTVVFFKHRAALLVKFAFKYSSFMTQVKLAYDPTRDVNSKEYWSVKRLVAVFHGGLRLQLVEHYQLFSVYQFITIPLQFFPIVLESVESGLNMEIIHPAFDEAKEFEQSSRGGIQDCFSS